MILRWVGAALVEHSRGFRRLRGYAGMPKLRLDPDALRVESFKPRDEPSTARGTVRAQSFIPTGDPFAGTCNGGASMYCQPTDYHVYTCGESCVNMCFHTGVAQTCAGD